MQRDFTIGGRKIETVWHGPGPQHAPTLVLLHEGLGCVAMWRDFPQTLAEHTGLGVLVYSRPGYGKSDRVSLPRSLTYMHDEALEVLPAVLDQAKIEKTILVGHSDGASIATIYAGSPGTGVGHLGPPLPMGERVGVRGFASNRDRTPSPGSLRSPPSPHGRGEQSQTPRLHGLVLMAPHFFCEEICVQSIAAAKEAYETTDMRERLARYHGDNVDVAFWGWNRVWLDPDFRTWTIREFLPNITVPTLIIQGRDDQYGTTAQIDCAREMARVPVEVLYLGNCQHSPQIDRPQETLEAIADFARKILADADVQSHAF